MRSKTLNEPANYCWNEVRVNSNEFSVAGRVRHLKESPPLINDYNIYKQFILYTGAVTE